MLAGSIANGKLANSSLSLGGVSISLGHATPAFDLTDATNYPTSSLTETITNAQLAGSIAINKLDGVDSSLTAAQLNVLTIFPNNNNVSDGQILLYENATNKFVYSNVPTDLRDLQEQQQDLEPQLQQLVL